MQLLRSATSPGSVCVVFWLRTQPNCRFSSSGGEAISIDGSGFGSTVPYVTVNGEQLTVTSNNDVRVEAEFPPLAPGSYPLRVLVDGKGLADIR